MKKFLFTFLLSTILCNTGFAESYYFKECKLNEIVTGNYIINLEKNIIEVTLQSIDGSLQELTDKIALVTKDQIVSEKIQSGKDGDSYFVYYLDVNSNSVIKQNYKKESEIDLVRPDGPKKYSYCENVKADWKQKKKKAQIEKEAEEKRKTELEEEKRKKKLKEKNKRAKELSKKQRNKHRISIAATKWIKLSEYKTSSEDQLKNDFDKKAAEICSPTGNFNIIEKKVEIIELDETPAFGVETVIKLGIAGVVECKQ